MMAMNMVKQGLFGEIVHCSGGYCHDLRDEIAFGKEKRHYRLRNYLARNCENYPTHELGPIARVLDINRGNRMVSLSSTASGSAGLHEFILKNKPDDAELRDAEFAQGDIVTTVIKCERGETIVLTLDTTLPRSYDRAFTIRGTAKLLNVASARYGGDWHSVPHTHNHMELFFIIGGKGQFLIEDQLHPVDVNNLVHILICKLESASVFIPLSAL